MNQYLNLYDINEIMPLFNMRKNLFDPDRSDFQFVSIKKRPVLKYPGTKRNAPCPCGSGKKYKKCCIDKIMNVESNQEEQHETTN